MNIVFLLFCVLVSCAIGALSIAAAKLADKGDEFFFALIFAAIATLCGIEAFWGLVMLILQIKAAI